MTAANPITIKPTPMMPAAGIEKLTELLGRSRCYLEYGSGGSTALAARIGVPDIFSVESDIGFIAAVRAAVAASGSNSRLHAMHVDIGPTREHGYPVDESGLRRWPDYPLLPWARLAEAGMEPDLVLVDGRFRVACALASALHLPAGRLIMIDDYLGRERKYGTVTRHLSLIETAGVAAIFETRGTRDAALASDLARYVVVPQ